MMNNVFAWLGTILSLAGNIGVIEKHWWGFACWLVANAIWVRHHWIKSDWPSVTLFVVYFLLSFWGLWTWL